MFTIEKAHSLERGIACSVQEFNATHTSMCELVKSAISSRNGQTFPKFRTLKDCKNKWSDVMDYFMIYCGGYH